MDRVFSKKCAKCRQRTVDLATISYSCEIDHDGRAYTVTLPRLTTPKCANCGTIVLDEEANQQISDAFRAEAGLLAPEQIRRLRESLELTQRTLSQHLGVAEATLSRWETGVQIQQRSLDKLLRAYFQFPDLRHAMAENRFELPRAAVG